jgi:glycosyltransferase involved in cell wall biosynthesis
MWASVQYLYCGIPIVTTPSRGGREYFLDDQHTYRAEPNTYSVKGAVDKAKHDCIEPSEIRSAILSKVTSERMRYIEFLKQEFGFRKKSTNLDIHDYLWGNDVGIKQFLWKSED